MINPRTFLLAAFTLAIGVGFYFSKNSFPLKTFSQPATSLRENAVSPSFAFDPVKSVAAIEKPTHVTLSEPWQITGKAWVGSDNDPVTAPFSEWCEKYLSASPQGKSVLENEGQRLAEVRREALKALIQNDPKRALENAVPFSVRRRMPESILNLLEERISGRGELAVMAVTPEPGDRLDMAPVFRTATLGGKEFKAFTYGRRLDQATKRDIPMNGIAVENLFAVNENPLRILENGEADEVLKPSEAICAVSGDATTRHDEETVVDVGGEIKVLCQTAHAGDLNDLILAESDVAASDYTEGEKKLLLIRVDFPDMSGVPFSDSTGTNLINGMNSFFRDCSYNRASFPSAGQGSDFTPTFRMTNNASYYGTNDFYNQLRSHARAAAASAGYILTNYNFDVICMRLVPGWSWGGLGYVGSPGAWVRSSSFSSHGVMAHEVGHNYGLHHANFWETGGLSIIGDIGTNVEYGDSFDTMGPANAGNYQFNTRNKRYLNWLRSNEVAVVTNSGTFRIFSHDHTNATGIRAISTPKNAFTNYWIEFRQKLTGNQWLMNGASVRWARSTGNQQSLLLDTSPASVDGKNDSALAIGRTLSDPRAGVHITPIRKGGTTPESLDVVVNRGTFPANVPPAISITASAANAATGAIVNFTATSSDANGDALAYYWDFGDSNFGTNGATASKSWSSSREYVVRCTVTDMKGGLASDSVIVRVGAPSTYRISGEVMNNNTPIEGVRVFVSSTLMTYTDSDGSFNLVGLPAGTYTVNAHLDGYTFFNRGFSNPVSVSPNATGIDFNTSTALPPSITAHPQSRFVAAGSNVTFSVTANGEAPLAYRWRFNDTPIANATVSTLLVSNAQLTNAGNYSVVVSNNSGVVTSSNAALTVNIPPSIAFIAHKSVVEHSLLTFHVVAADANGLTYSLEPNAPIGAAIHPSSGAFSWTPTEMQGPGQYNLIVRVTDNGVPALSSTNIFQVSVIETNSAPAFASVSNKFVHAGEPLTFTNFAGDSDWPANRLTFSLGANLQGNMSIDSSSGIFTWTAPSSNISFTNVIGIVVTDNGIPALSDTMNFEVVVIPPLQVAEITAMQNGALVLIWPSFPGKRYQLQYKNSLNEVAWINEGGTIVADDVTITVTHTPSSQANRFFRIVQID